MTDERIAAAASAFGPAAADYELARPSYPPEALDVVVRELGVGPGARVLDLAAGTGKLTRLLAATGAAVTAVEPVPGMRARIEATSPDVTAVDGTAEDIPFPDASFDVVTVAQAFHWFRLPEAFAEIRRVLRPGGGLAILFNERDGRIPWVADWNAAIEWHSRTISVYQTIDWTATMADGGFGDIGGASVEWVQPMTRDLVAARVRSVSYVAEEPADVQQQYVDRVLAIVEREGFGHEFPLPYVTHVWWGRSPAP